MYRIISNVINRGGYNLATVLSKIDTVWGEGGFTNEQRDELYALARKGVNLSGNVEILTKIEELEKRIRILEEGGSTAVEGYPEYTVGKWYYAGDKCYFKGINYICVAPEGVACVWSPTDYPTYWEAVQ